MFPSRKTFGGRIFCGDHRTYGELASTSTEKQVSRAVARIIGTAMGQGEAETNTACEWNDTHHGGFVEEEPKQEICRQYLPVEASKIVPSVLFFEGFRWDDVKLVDLPHFDILAGLAVKFPGKLV
tara:strand:+ start:78 stop:452 length:375 start_codon:yes stop_codon:yes gene_type:complete